VITSVGSIDNILASFINKGFIAFRENADTKIGTVTGADSFFIADRQFALEMGLRENEFQRIVKSLRKINGLCFNGDCPDKVLMHFPSKHNNAQVTKYLELDIRPAIHVKFFKV